MAYMAFSGSFEHSLDGKGRVIIPASFREALGENFTITINPTRTAVAIYPKADWDGQLERLSHINPMDKIGLQYERYLMSVSFSGNSMDAQGRVLIPAKLRAKIGLTRDIRFRRPEPLYRGLGRRGLRQDGGADGGRIRFAGGLRLRKIPVLKARRGHRYRLSAERESAVLDGGRGEYNDDRNTDDAGQPRALRQRGLCRKAHAPGGG